MKRSAAIRSVFFNSYTGLGGGETSLLALLGALDPRAHRPALVTPRDGPFPDSVRALGFDTRIVPYRGASLWFVPALWARLPAVGRMVTALRELGPRIVFSDFHSLAFALPACRALGLPLVFLCWGWWFRPRPWQRAFFRKGPTTILALSEAIKSGFLGTPPFMPPDRIRVLHPGVDISRFRPRPRARIEVRRELGLVADVRLVTLLARFQTVKGHEVFLAAARRMAGRSPGVRFVIAGESIFGHAADEALKRRVISRVQKDPLLRERVKLLGWVAGPEELLAASDVLVCSSRFESFGMVLVEAMASGVAVVSTWVGGPAEIVIDGETGYLVPPGRPDLIADRVLNLLEDEDLRTRMGAAGRIRARDRFSLRRYADSFSSLLESIAGPA